MGPLPHYLSSLDTTLPLSGRLPYIKDELFWTSSPNAFFTTSSCYSFLSSPTPLIPLVQPQHAKWLWKILVPNKIKFFSLLCWHTHIKTRTFLAAKGVPIDIHYQCPNHSEEDIDHSLRNCHFASPFGINIFIFCHLSYLTFYSLTSTLRIGILKT